MPDVLHWLGVRRIHRLVSMSNMKYDAIVGSGIEVGTRVKIPEELVPADARVEIDAKKAAGYFTDGDVPDAEHLCSDEGTVAVMLRVAPAPAAELLSTRAIRERCGNITRAVEAGHSNHFRIDRAKLQPAARAVADVTRRRYRDLDIPYHSRWRHFAAGARRSQGRARSPAEARQRHAERLRAQLDLAVISVLLDAGRRVRHGVIASRERSTITRARKASASRALRVSRRCVFGIAGRADARRRGRADRHRCGRRSAAGSRWPRQSAGRPRRPRRVAAPAGRCPRNAPRPVRPDVATLRAVRSECSAHGRFRRPRSCVPCSKAFGPIWRANAEQHGDAGDDRMPGDVWRHPHAGGNGPTAGFVPFHKLSQWLAYSLFEPFEWAGYTIVDRDALTALPEYRNGGLLIDSGRAAAHQRCGPLDGLGRRQRDHRRMARADGIAARRSRGVRARGARPSAAAARVRARRRDMGRRTRIRVSLRGGSRLEGALRRHVF